MKAVACAAVLFGLVSTALAQTIAPSPTESVGCEPHGDHWHCEAPRETSLPAGTITTTSAAPTIRVTTTSSAAHDGDDHDHGEHTDASGTGSLAPSPTESYGCEPHGDHWHCEGPVTAFVSVSTTLLKTTTTAANQTAGAASTSASTAGGARHAATGLAVAGLAAVAAVAL
ncbi:hypothetical protein C8A03DRAFT_37199 [Achaetomium macrosporum]|uniref:Uncharacterized protein n=1 Tax=Achaetomium macrosporum TaxID=79813 RepID=A0AAN7C409_9PEZI|nr:hypothetical protein C8A03DRAFT_37199 [Achaetomium macrosporum]